MGKQIRTRSHQKLVSTAILVIHSISCLNPLIFKKIFFLHIGITKYVSPDDVPVHGSAVFCSDARHSVVAPARRFVRNQGDVPRCRLCSCLPLLSQVRIQEPVWPVSLDGSLNAQQCIIRPLTIAQMSSIP